MLDFPISEKWKKRTYTVPGFALTSSATPKVDPYTVQFDKTSWTIITSLSGTGSLGAWSTLITKNGVSYMNDFMRNASLWGTPDFPHFLARPIAVEPGATFSFNFLNHFAGPNVLNLALNGIAVYDTNDAVRKELQRLSDGSQATGMLEYYAYVLRRQFAAAERFTMSLQVDGDYDFAALDITGYSDGAFQYRIAQGNANGDAWDDTLIPKGIMFGRAEHPFPLHARFIPAAGTLSVDTQDLSGAPNFVEIALEGLKYRVK